MAWSWSHTTEAYENAQRNLEDLPKEELDVIYAEWVAWKRGHAIARAEAEAEGDEYNEYVHEAFDESAYNSALKSAQMESRSGMIVKIVWPYVEEFATCDNGGFNAWVCPYGCHTVPFDRNEPQGDES